MGYNNEHNLGDLLYTMLNQMGMAEQSEAIEVENIYRNIVGDLINKLTLSVRYERNILYIKLASAALRNELSYKKQSLVDKINGQLKHGAVNEIIFE
ncbi:MAG: DUF721 domain-containing protein [Bacteroidales bacterium]|nr:DUF721 domain-containing protein [Bacteroidales bacterium]